MAENRLPRTEETRETGQRRKKWQRPEVLPTPDPRDGWEHRWVRVSTQGADDPSNISSKLREGWEVCKAKEYPELMADPGGHPRFKDGVLIGGLMLCRIATEMAEQRDEHFRQVAANQIQSVDNSYMRENDPRMPLFKDRQTEVTFGRGE